MKKTFLAIALAFLFAATGPAFARQTLTGNDITDNSLTDNDLANGSVGPLEIKDNSITSTDIQSSSVFNDINLDIKRTTVIDANYTALTTDTIIGYTHLSASRTVTLPAAASATQGKIYFVKDESDNASASVPIVVDGNGTETIDGQLTISITANMGVLRIYSSGANWFTL